MRQKGTISTGLIILTALSGSINIALAQWPDDPTVNLPVCTEEQGQLDQRIVSTGNGGAIIIWSDARAVSYNSTYGQLVTAEGSLQWLEGGVELAPGGHDQIYPVAIADGAGGVITAWGDRRNFEDTHWDVYAQRSQSDDGNALWGDDGLVICTAAAEQEMVCISADGAGGAFFIWEDWRLDGYQRDLFAQHVNASGVPQWTSNGVSVCTESHTQRFAQAVSDGAGGVIVTWSDERYGTDTDIYAQRLSADGVPLWTADGVAVCSADEAQNQPLIVTDGAGGAIIVWQDPRNIDETWFDIYAQRLDATGVPLWAVDGIAVTDAINSQTYYEVAADESGGVMVTWYDARNYETTDWDIYAQHLNPDGIPLWGADELAVCTEEHEQKHPAICSDGVCGAVITWYDERSGQKDIYAQRVCRTGEIVVLMWEEQGAAIAISNQLSDSDVPELVTDGDGGAIITWVDERNWDQTNRDIYAQRVYWDGSLAPESAGNTPSQPQEFTLNQNYPNPFNPVTTISYSLTIPATVRLEVYNLVGERIVTLVDGWQAAGGRSVQFDGGDLPGGLYLVVIHAGQISDCRKMLLVK